MTNIQLLDQLYYKVLSKKSENKKKLEQADGIVELSFATAKDFAYEDILYMLLIAKCDVLTGKEEIE